MNAARCIGNLPQVSAGGNLPQLAGSAPCSGARTYYSARAVTYSPAEPKRIKPGLKAADATRFPRLYWGTYWGAFKLDENADAITAEIIENRNRFARRWRLRRLVEMVGRYPAKDRGEDFDHPETYRDADGWIVLVVSNYNAPPPGVLGMVRIAPIYSTAAESYVGRFASVRELKARLAACGGDGRPYSVTLGDGKARAGAEAVGASRGQPGPRVRERRG